MPRRSQPLSTEQKALVSSVRRIAKQRMRINASYVDAVVKAREAGVTFSAIAEAAGMSSQAAQEIFRRHGSPDTTSASTTSASTTSASTASDARVTPLQPEHSDAETTQDATASATASASGVHSGVPQGAAAVTQEVGTQDPTE